MPRRKVSGICHLCGANGPLSFEHVPPRAAFNDRPAVLYHADQIIGLGPGERPATEGKISQRGVGAYTLCGRCNNATGRWYGKRFAAWCFQGLETMVRTEGKPTLVYLHYLFPLAIIKQIATMFFSVNGERFHIVQPELASFVLDKERKGLSPKYRFFMYYYSVGVLRSAGVTGRIDVRNGETIVFSELTFPPFGYVLTFGDGPPDPQMVEITHFSRYGYEEFAVTEIRFPTLPTHLSLPGDYRTHEQIMKDREKELNEMRADV